MDASIFLSPPFFPFPTHKPPLPACKGKNDKEAPTACSSFQQIFSYLFIFVPGTYQCTNTLTHNIGSPCHKKENHPYFRNGSSVRLGN